MIFDISFPRARVVRVICVRTFEANGKKEMRRICVDGPVFDLQECLGW